MANQERLDHRQQTQEQMVREEGKGMQAVLHNLESTKKTLAEKIEGIKNPLTAERMKLKQEMGSLSLRHHENAEQGGPRRCLHVAEIRKLLLERLDNQCFH